MKDTQVSVRKTPLLPLKLHSSATQNSGSAAAGSAGSTRLGARSSSFLTSRHVDDHFRLQWGDGDGFRMQWGAMETEDTLLGWGEKGVEVDLGSKCVNPPVGFPSHEIYIKFAGNCSPKSAGNVPLNQPVIPPVTGAFLVVRESTQPNLNRLSF
ncbi:hypothetical protein PIB30_069027 [Stylosanthes scabra]|uniref:Uncharacterized protein n=1 Tax=Stylosanthes scabra TaxID=79078 RepID=A0ABU6QNU6_9FABA|nr:hypothetical protein [Stylosanthes scabra]